MLRKGANNLNQTTQSYLHDQSLWSIRGIVNDIINEEYAFNNML